MSNSKSFRFDHGDRLILLGALKNYIEVLKARFEESFDRDDIVNAKAQRAVLKETELLFERMSKREKEVEEDADT